MKTRLVRIGNSRGIRLPKPLIDQAGLSGEVDLQVRDGAIVIAPSQGVRTGWAAAAAKLVERDEGGLLDTAPTRFDVEEWKW